MNFLLRTSKSFRQLLIENYKAACFYAEDALDHIEDLPFTICQIELGAPKSYDDDLPLLVHLSGERVFACIIDTLYVYFISEPSLPIASYPLGEICTSAKIVENFLYLGSATREFLLIFEVPTSLTEPLTLFSMIKTNENINDMFRNGNELLLSEFDGWLEVFDIISATISHTWQFKEISLIQAFEGIDKTKYLLASRRGLFKST